MKKSCKISGSAYWAVASLVLIFIIQIAPAQVTTFQKFIGKGTETAKCIKQTSDGGYILLGASQYKHVLLVKFDCTGKAQWMKNYMGTDTTKTESGSYVEQTSDCGFIIAGTASSFSGQAYAWLIRTDAAGAVS